MAFLSRGCLPQQRLFVAWSPRSAGSQAGTFTEPWTMSQPTREGDGTNASGTERPAWLSTFLGSTLALCPSLVTCCLLFLGPQFSL